MDRPSGLGEIRRADDDGAQDAGAAAAHADLVISPDVSGVDLLDWNSMPAMRMAGRAAAREALRAKPLPTC